MADHQAGMGISEHFLNSQPWQKQGSERCQQCATAGKANSLPPSSEAPAGLPDTIWQKTNNWKKLGEESNMANLVSEDQSLLTV